MAYPLQYEARFTKKFCILMAIATFLLPYIVLAAFLVGDVLIPEMRVWPYQVTNGCLTVSILCILVNQGLHYGIYRKLKQCFKTTVYGSISINDPKFLEMRQVIRANFFQSVIPLISQGPLMLSSLALIFFYQKQYTIAHDVIYNLSNIAFLMYMSNTFFEPLFIILIIGSYRELWKAISPKSKLILVLIFVGFIIGHFILFCLITVFVALTNNFELRF